MSTIPKDYPLLKDDRADFPEEETHCSVCGAPLAPVRVTLAGGAAGWDAASMSYGPSDAMLGYMNLQWDEERPKDPDSEFLVASLPIVESVKGGQYSIVTCSVACMRSLVGSWLDELEARAVKEMGDLETLKSRLRSE